MSTDFHLERMLAGIGEEPLHQGCRALGRLARGVEQAADPVVAVGDAPQGEIDIAENGGEKIVEVMRDAAGQAADRFHFLRLPQGAFGQFAAPDFLHELRMRQFRPLGPAQGHEAHAEQRDASRGCRKCRWLAISRSQVVDDGLAVQSHRDIDVGVPAVGDRRTCARCRRSPTRPRQIPCPDCRRIAFRIGEFSAAVFCGAGRSGKRARIAPSSREEGGDGGLRERAIIIGEIFGLHGDDRHAVERAVGILAAMADRKKSSARRRGLR